ncbi:helix-turn-helix transcriptional regulator [Capillimicrobium parvum]|uniref:helix-turn-helix transcriptional regulator n=1 Tax=Capillimicrobium parvum TaxID=2884022 RepID=UPI00389901AD
MAQVAHNTAGWQSDRLVPASEVAGLLGVSRSTVVRLADRGDLRPVRLSSRCTRYRMSDVVAFIEARQSSASADDA